MNLTIVSASQRKASESYRVSCFLSGLSQEYFDKIDVLDLYERNLPLRCEGEIPQEVLEVKKQCARTDAFIFVVPEWGGAVTPVLSNLLLWVTQKEVGHKPTLITAISSGVGGANPVGQLRAYGFKNNRINYIPEHLIVRKVKNVLDSEDQNSKDFVFLKERAIYVIELLSVYSRSLRYVRESGVINEEKFPFGM